MMQLRDLKIPETRYKGLIYMKWYNSSLCDGIVISSRVRIARNLASYHFTPRLTSEERMAMLMDVRSVFEKYGKAKYNYVEISEKSEAERLSYVEKHLISREFATLPASEKRTLIYDDDGNFSVMVGEEDHLRIQAIRPGFDVDDAFSAAECVDNMLEAGLEFAFSEKLGYLTCCPSNTGTGLRVSVMLHLPMLTRNNYMKSIIEFCTRMGLTVRGFYGEGSTNDGDIYQISNQMTLGISAEETLIKIKDAVGAIIEKEEALRDLISSDNGASCDRLWRSYGILKFARKLSSSEFISLWSDILLAKSIGITDELKNKNLTKLLIECMPSHIILENKEYSSDTMRDIRRSQKVREFLNS